MIPHLTRSRIVKALTDRGDGGVGYDAAEARLAAIRVAIVLGADQARTAAGQAAALTAVATSCKCFGHAVLVADAATKLLRTLPMGASIGAAAKSLGAATASAIPDTTTHVIAIGCEAAGTAPFV